MTIDKDLSAGAEPLHISVAHEHGSHGQLTPMLLLLCLPRRCCQEVMLTQGHQSIWVNDPTSARVAVSTRNSLVLSNVLISSPVEQTCSDSAS